MFMAIESTKCKKLIIRSQNKEEEDRLSSLTDDVIHQILSFLGTRLAVQTSILSNRWKNIWKSLPFLTFDWYDQLFPYTHSGIIKFIDHVLSHRNHETHVVSFKFFAVYPIPVSLVEKFIEYPIEHNVQDLDIDLYIHRYDPIKLSTFSSVSIQKLKLRVRLDFGELLESDCCWDLPVLTTLHLICPPHLSKYMLPESCLICLPALTTLCLDGIELPELLSSSSLPALTNLSMGRCKLPETVWEFPALLSLELDDVQFPENTTDFFSALVGLRNLTLIFQKRFIQDCFISCPHLVYLKICTSMTSSITPIRKIVVLSTMLRELYCVGILLFTLNVHELENVNIKLWDTNAFKNVTMSGKKAYYQQFVPMFLKLGSAKILTLDSATVEALSTVSDFLKRSPSPFSSLKYVILPQGYKESSISTTLRKYLLGGNPRATIVTTLPQNNVNHHVVPVSLTSPKVMLDEPLATPTEKLIDSQDIHKTVSVDTVEKRVQVEHLMENSGVDADKVRQVGASVAGTGNDWASSSRGNNDFGVWQGHEINLEFVGLLDLIMKKYPETFEHFTAKSKRFYKMKLNILCTSVNDLLRTSMTEFNNEIIAEYRDLFADLQKWGFNVNWLVSHLNYIEQLQFTQHEFHAIDSRIDDAGNKLQDLQTLCMEKMT